MRMAHQVKTMKNPKMTKSEPEGGVPPATISIAIVEDDAGIRANLADIVGRSADCRLVATFANAESALVEFAHAQTTNRSDGHQPPWQNRRRMCAGTKMHSTGNPVHHVDGLRRQRVVVQSARCRSHGLSSETHFTGKNNGSNSRSIRRRFTIDAADCASCRPTFFSTSQTIARVEKLSPREMEILQQFAKGYRYKEIVDNLGISMDTVRTHVRSMFNKLHVHPEPKRW